MAAWERALEAARGTGAELRLQQGLEQARARADRTLCWDGEKGGQVVDLFARLRSDGATLQRLLIRWVGWSMHACTVA